jgi:multidrug efflux pump
MQRRAVRIQVDPFALAGAGLSLEDVRTALVAANVNQPKGNIDGHRQDYTIATDDQLMKSDDYNNVIVAYKNGAAVRLVDVAKPVDGAENTRLAAWANGKRAVILNVQRQPGANVIEVSDRIKALIPRLRSAIPQGIDIAVLQDRTESVRASVEDVEFTLVITIGLVVLVVFSFLRTLRATSIPSVAVPLSLVGTFGVMYLLGYSLNNLSLMALTIATGFVVDDAIVMVENVARHVEHGMKPFQAALKGAKEIGFTIVSLTVSLVAVLIPLLFMRGLVGRLFREFAVTLAAAIVLSALLSLTLTAMMSAHILKPEPPPSQRGHFYRMSEAAFDWMVARYDTGLKFVLNHQKTTLFVVFLTMGLTGYLAWAIPKALFPKEDTGLVNAVLEAPPDVSFDRITEIQQRLSEIVRSDPAVADVAAFVGADGTNTSSNTGRMTVVLKPRKERDSVDDVLERLSPRTREVPGVSVWFQTVQDLTIDVRQSRTPFQYTVEDADPNELADWAPKIVDALGRAPELRDVTTDSLQKGLGVDLTIDRDTASRVGISTQLIDDTLYDAFGQRQISTIFTQLNLYRVILELKPEMQRDPGVLDVLHLPSVGGTLSPLSAFVHRAEHPAPLVVTHQGQFPAITVSFDVPPRESLGSAVHAVQHQMEELKAPVGIRGEFQGTAQAFRESLESEPMLILAALITVYIVLGVLYESTVHPITILSTLPSAGVGALLALWLFRMPFTLVALIGIILLIGIVKKNAIMMIDFALEAQREGKTPREAIHEACLLRFRPIMMTTMAALLGAIPLAIGTGTGSELRRPLGVSIVGGLVLSQVLTLFTTPVIYLELDKIRAKLSGLFGIGGESDVPDEAE